MIASEWAILNGRTLVATPADNATTTATLPKGLARPGTANVITGFHCYYSAAVNASKNVVITYTDNSTEAGVSQTLTYPWDFTNGAFYLSLPGVLRCHPFTQPTVALDASGTGGILGNVTVYFFTFG